MGSSVTAMEGQARIRGTLRVSLQSLLLCTAVVMDACAWGAHASKAPSEGQATAGMVTRGDLEIVECLLPGQVRSLGTSTYLSQRRPVRTTTSDCRIRGGEFVAYDRADYKSALRIWMQAAEAGDAEAQNNVGEIYERGLGDVPNYAAAAIWYQKAADQKYSRALFNLGTLYEAGLGVDQDQLKALNLYRQAWGLPADSVMFESAARREQEALRAELTQAVCSCSCCASSCRSCRAASSLPPPRPPRQPPPLGPHRPWRRRPAPRSIPCANWWHSWRLSVRQVSAGSMPCHARVNPGPERRSWR